jgi:outer membrane immunogenic protein
MKRLLAAITTLAGVAGGPTSAHAADVVDSCADTWTGLYIGAHGGYQTGDTDTVGAVGDADIDGIVGGGLAGYNVQYCQFLVGVEGDIGFGEIDGRDGTVRDFDLEPQGHVRVRAGWVWDDSVVPFIAAGLALADMDVRLTGGGGKDSHVHAGFSIGGGLDVRVTESIVLRAEYIYDHYESINYAIGGGVNVDTDPHTVRGAIMWHF